MSLLLAQFERDCLAAGVAPKDALIAGGVHPSLWFKWVGQGDKPPISPQLRSFEAALAGLEKLKRDQRVVNKPQRVNARKAENESRAEKNA